MGRKPPVKWGIFPISGYRDRGALVYAISGTVDGALADHILKFWSATSTGESWRSRSPSGST